MTIYLPEGGVINYQKEYGGGYKTDEGNEYSLIEDVYKRQVDGT